MKADNQIWWLGIAFAACFGITATAQVRHAKARPVADRVALNETKIATAKTYGVSNAPIRIDEYSDFECPHCQDLYLNTLRPLISDFVANGKVYLVHHDFPLPGHEYARQAAYYVDAAAVIGKLGPVEEAVFQHQPQWEMNGKVEPFISAVLSAADWKRVQELSQSPEIRAAVQHDVESGQRLGVNETPTMFITYKGQQTPIIGDVSYPILRQYLDALLKQ